VDSYRNLEFKISDRLKEIFGFLPTDEVTLEDAIKQISPDYKEQVALALQTAIRDSSRFEMEYPLVGYHDGKLRWVRGVGTVQRSGNKPNVFTGVVHEITEHKMDEIRKNDFIGMVSHELKTPLTSLSGYVQLMERKALKNEDSFMMNALETASRQVKKMSTMIDGFLNISRLESGKIVLHKSQFDLRQLVDEAIEDNLRLENKTEIIFNCDTAINILADRDKISSVISNFVSNAIKYSAPGGKVLVETSIADGQATLSVADEGQGIKQTDLEKVFERFYRVGDNQNISGFGIGLYLSAEIISRHDGKIWATSNFGTGSVFYFSIPILAS
jgi:two-component system sensor histidine kinase VicK